MNGSSLASLGVRKALLGGVAVAGALGLGYAVSAHEYSLLGLLVAGIVGAVLASRDSRLIDAIVVTAFVWTQVMYVFSLPPLLTNVVDLLVGLLIGRTLVRVVLTRDLRVDGWVVQWLAVMAVVSLASVGAGMIALQSLAAYLVFPLFFVAVVNAELTEAEEKRTLLLVGLMMAMQVPLSIMQKASAYSESFDRVGGSFGRAGTPTMSVVMGFAWCGILAVVVGTGKLRYAALLPLIMIPLALGAANAGFVFAALGSFAILVVCLRLSGTAGFRVLLVVATAAPILVVYSVYAFAPELIASAPGIRDFGLSFFRDPAARLAGYLTGYQKGVPNRFEQLRFALDQARDAPALLLGHGLGVLSTSALLGRGGYAATWSILGSAISVTKYFVETGAFGVGAFVAFVASLWPGTLIAPANRGGTYCRFLVVWMSGMVPVYLLAGMYSPAWQSSPVAMPFFLVAAFCVRAIARQRTGRHALSA